MNGRFIARSTAALALAEKLKRFLRRDSMLLSNLPKQDPHTAILRLSGGFWITRPIMGVHIPNGQFLCELQIRPEVPLIGAGLLQLGRARPLAVGITTLTSNASGEDNEDHQQQEGPMRPNRTSSWMPDHMGQFIFPPNLLAGRRDTSPNRPALPMLVGSPAD